MDSSKPLIAITMGDPAGSGPEITLKALKNKSVQQIARYVLVGDLKVFRKASEIIGANELNFVKISSPSETSDAPQAINVIDLDDVDMAKLVYGKASSLGGKSAYDSISKAVQYALSNEVHAVVTAPISKDSLNSAGYNYPGHTELLADLTGAKDVKMMLVAGLFKVVHVTTHVSMREVLDLIKKDRVLKTLELTQQSLVELFGTPQARIAVAGLNPHAGENGLFGNEEINEISPAIKEAAAKGVNVTGPYPPDTIFYRAYYVKQFDVVIAMYHDQGHIAMKMVGFMEGVNLSLGLPIIRTSPDHGTVWGKAGKGTGNETATLEAIKLAVELSTKKFKLCV